MKSNYRTAIEASIVVGLAVGLCLAIIVTLKKEPIKTFKVGECLVHPQKLDGFYMVKKITKNSYIMRAYGTYIKIRRDIPVLVSKGQHLEKIDCMKDIQKEYLDTMTQIQEEIVLDKVKAQRMNRYFLPPKKRGNI